MRTHQPLPQDDQIKQQLSRLVADLKKPEDITDFLSTFLTEAELSMFARRLEILRRLNENESYLTIQRDLHVSSATVAAVAQLRELENVQRYLAIVQKRHRSGWFGR